MRYLSGTSEDAIRCPKVFDGEDDTIVVQGAVVQDPAVTGVTLPDDGEAVVRIPRWVFETAARRLLVGEVS